MREHRAETSTKSKVKDGLLRFVQTREQALRHEATPYALMELHIQGRRAFAVYGRKKDRPFYSKYGGNHAP